MSTAAHTGFASRQVLGIPVQAVDYALTLQHIRQWLEPDAGPSPPSGLFHICTVNPEFILETRRNPAFRTVLRHAELNVPDGAGILWALRLQGIRLPARVTGTDLIPYIARLAARQGWRLFLLGAAPGVAEQAARQLCTAHPALQICGTYSGSPADQDWPAIQTQLHRSRPHILLVAFGHPRQDLWIAQHRADLAGMVAMGVGGAFDFLAGHIRRAPPWMQQHGLEWLFRLCLQPRRWRRMIRLPWFVVLVLVQYIRNRVQIWPRRSGMGDERVP